MDFLSPILFNLTLQKVIQSTKMFPSGINIGKQQLNVLALCKWHCTDWKKLNRNKTTFCRNRKHCQKVRTTDKPRKNKYMIVEEKNNSKQNK